MIEVSAIQIAQLIGAEIEGNPDVIVRRFDKIEEATEGSLSFIANPKYEGYAAVTKASVLLVRKDFTLKPGGHVTLLKVADPYTALAFLLGKLNESNRVKKSGIHASAYIPEDAQIGDEVYIGAFVSLGKGVKINKGAQFCASSYLYF